MRNLDDISEPPAQEGTSGAMPQAILCALRIAGSKLDAADPIFGGTNPELEQFQDARGQPVMFQYMEARYDYERARHVPPKDLSEARFKYQQAKIFFDHVEVHCRGEGLRVIANAWVTFRFAERDFDDLRREYARGFVERNGRQRREVVNEIIKTGRTKKIDGVRVP